ncbi:MAG: Ig-like domain-containing protein [Acutalibacteraceae bacterium]|nr:Ig-like domain-containing protein [Acutalibacteraceae bacterium]
MKGKKFLAVLMSALIISTTTVCSTSVSAYKEDNTVVSEADTKLSYTVGGETFYYDVTDNKVTILVYEGNGKNVVIPNEIDGMPVTEIYVYAFAKGESFNSITIPKNVKYFPIEIFDRSYNIKEIIVDPENSNYSSVNGVLYNKDKTTLLYYPPAKAGSSFTIPSTVKEIGRTAFLRNKNLESIKIPNSVTILGDSSFDGCEKLKSVTLPDSITNMGVYVFANCNSLTTAKLSKNAQVGPYAFTHCKKLNSVTIPEGVETIYNCAFWECVALKDIKLPDTLKEIKSFAFGGAGIKNITIPKSVTLIVDKAIGYITNEEKNNDFVIYGYNGTEAERYAINNGFSFSTVGSQTQIVKLNKESIKMGVNESYTLKPTLSPAGATATYKWKSDNTSVATVNSNGKITAKAEGTVNITVETANGSKANCKVTVKKAPKSVSLNKTAITLGIGEEFDFNSSLSDGSASYSTVYSSSNPSVVSVKAGGGLATGKKTGTATITVKTYNGKTASCKVTVKKAPTSISLNKSSVTLGIGDYIDLNSKMPSGEASRVVTYTSSDKSIATVNGSGLVNAKKLGTVTITAKTYNGKTTTCKVTVKNAPSSVSLNKSKITIGIGETFDFNSSIPSGTASYSRSFYSYNSNIVSINKAGGLATGKSVGSATIRVTTHNDKNAYADVTVKKAPTSVSLNKTSATLGVGEKIDLNSKLPSGEASRVVTYTTADKSIATVDGSGVVTAKKTGTVIITAKTYNGKTATCKITVKKAPTSVSLNKTSVSLKVGEKVDLNSKMPSGEASRVVTYTSADTSIATVDGSGVVTAKKKGTAIITAKTYNGKTATCRVIVR